MKHRTILKACLFAGLLPGVLAPLLWPFVPTLMDGKSMNWGLVLFSLFPVSIFALIGGLLGCLVLGVPVLVLLEKYGINRPIISIMVGSALGLLIALTWSLPAERSLVSSWPFVLFFIILGAACAGLASYLCRPNKAPQPTR